MRALLFSAVTADPGTGAELPMRQAVAGRAFRVQRPGGVGVGVASMVRVPDAEGTTLDKDRTAGAAEQAKGSIKEAIGKVTGNTGTQAEGAADKAAGEARNTAGGAKDAVRDAADK